jgi:cytoskeletal protein RodZ
MNWFLMLVSAVAGGVATWLWSVRKVRRQIPVYESKTASGAAAFAGASEGVVSDDSVVSADADVSAHAESVPVAAPLVGEQGVLSGLETAAPAEGTGGGGAAAAEPSPKRKPRTKKKAAAPAAQTAPADDVTATDPGEVATLVGDPANPNGWTIKGNADSGLYHSPKSPSYKRTKAEAWFFSEAEAEAAGFTRWDRGEKK